MKPLATYPPHRPIEAFGREASPTPRLSGSGGLRDGEGFSRAKGGWPPAPVRTGSPLGTPLGPLHRLAGHPLAKRVLATYAPHRAKGTAPGRLRSLLATKGRGGGLCPAPRRGGGGHYTPRLLQTAKLTPNFGFTLKKNRGRSIFYFPRCKLQINPTLFAP